MHVCIFFYHAILKLKQSPNDKTKQTGSQEHSAVLGPKLGRPINVQDIFSILSKY